MMFGFLGALKKRAAKGAAKPIGQWKTGRVEKFVASGKGTAAQQARAQNVLARRNIQAPPPSPPPTGNTSPPPTGNTTPSLTVGQWNDAGTAWWSGSAWIYPPTTGAGGGTTGGGTSYGSGWDTSAGGDAWSDLYGNATGGGSAGGSASRSGTSSDSGTDAGATGGGSGVKVAVLAAVAIGAYLILRGRKGKAR